MASRLLSSTLRQAQRMQTGSVSSWEKIGNREVVGFGFKGQPNYVDRVDFPMPAIRFKETSPDIEDLQEKEKGDWRKLNLEEKKALYRASCRQTFAEVKAPTGMEVCDRSLTHGYFTVYVDIHGMKLFVFPESFDPERKEAQLKRMIDLRVNPIHGLTSKWDYEQGKWK